MTRQVVTIRTHTLHAVPTAARVPGDCVDMCCVGTLIASERDLDEPLELWAASNTCGKNTLRAGGKEEEEERKRGKKGETVPIGGVLRR